MRVAVTGSIATDHLMVFPGRFTDQLIADRLERVSLSFLADSLEIRYGGVAANIAYGLARLGLRPLLVGAVGADFGEYRARLEAAGVDTSPVRVSAERHTARFVCTTDAEQNQIATFYAGAMAEAAEIDLGAVRRTAGGLDLVVVSPDDPQAMLRHTAECRRAGTPFAADPSQQLPRLDAQQVRLLIDGARYLFTNEYEAALLGERTGWTERRILGRVGTWITTRGGDGVVIRRCGERPVTVPAIPTTAPVDPTGVGDAFRAGFLSGTAWGWPTARAVQLGCALATVVLESVGSQEYEADVARLLPRIVETHGAAAADEIGQRLAEAA